LAIPAHAVVWREKKPHVWLVDGGRARLVPIKTGIDEGGAVEVVGGLSGEGGIAVGAGRAPPGAGGGGRAGAGGRGGRGARAAGPPTGEPRLRALPPASGPEATTLTAGARRLAIDLSAALELAGAGSYEVALARERTNEAAGRALRLWEAFAPALGPVASF